jgi:hypothetical protein
MIMFISGDKERDDMWVPHVILYQDGFGRSSLGSATVATKKIASIKMGRYLTEKYGVCFR